MKAYGAKRKPLQKCIVDYLEAGVVEAVSSLDKIIGDTVSNKSDGEVFFEAS